MQAGDVEHFFHGLSRQAEVNVTQYLRSPCYQLQSYKAAPKYPSYIALHTYLPFLQPIYQLILSSCVDHYRGQELTIYNTISSNLVSTDLPLLRALHYIWSCAALEI